MQGELLQAAIREKGMSITGLAHVMRMDRAVLYSRIAGRTEFKVSEALRITKILGITKKQMEQIFFTDKVD